MRLVFTRVAIAASLAAGAIALNFATRADPNAPAPTAKPAPAGKADKGGPADLGAMSDRDALARLKAEAGTWDVAMSLWFGPSAEPVTTKATLTAAMTLGGMYLEQRFEGVGLGPKLPDLKWTSLSYTGYNATTRQYEAVRMASTQSTMIIVRGPMNADGSMELSGDYTLMGMKSTQRDVITHQGPDSERIESWMTFGDNPEFKGAEMVLTRRK